MPLSFVALPQHLAGSCVTSLTYQGASPPSRGSGTNPAAIAQHNQQCTCRQHIYRASVRMAPPPLKHTRMQEPFGLVFVSMPSIIDPSVAPAGRHVVHAFTSDWVTAWQVRQPGQPAWYACSGALANRTPTGLVAGRCVQEERASWRARKRPELLTPTLLTGLERRGLRG